MLQVAQIMYPLPCSHPCGPEPDEIQAPFDVHEKVRSHYINLIS
jgi:hypothetical protein